MSHIMHKISEALHHADDKFSVTNGDPVQDDLDKKAAQEQLPAQVAVAQQEMEDKEGRKGMHDNSTQGGHTVMYHGRAVPDSNAFDEQNALHHSKLPERHPVSDTYLRPGESERLEDEAVRAGTAAGDDLSL